MNGHIGISIWYKLWQCENDESGMEASQCKSQPFILTSLHFTHMHHHVVCIILPWFMFHHLPSSSPQDAYWVYSVLHIKVILLSLEPFLLLPLHEALDGNLRTLSWQHQPIRQPMGTFEGLSVEAYIVDIASGTLSSWWGPILTKPSLTHAWPPLNVFTA